MFLTFIGDIHCCSIETVAETKPISTTTACRTFPVDIVPSELHMGLKSVPTLHHMQPDLMDLFDNQVIMMKKCQVSMNSIVHVLMISQPLDNMKQIRDKTVELITSSNCSITFAYNKKTVDQMKNKCLEIG